MALLGKFFGALRSAARCFFAVRQRSSQVSSCCEGSIEAVEALDKSIGCISTETTSDIVDSEKKEKVTPVHVKKDFNPVADFAQIRLVKDESGTFIEADGEKYTLFQFSKKFGIKFGTLYGRVKKGLDIRDIINVPRNVNRDYSKTPPVKAKLWEWNGEKHTIGEWAKIYGVQKAMMRIRLTTYGSPERNTEKLEAYKKRRARRFAWDGETHTAKEWAEIYKVPERTMLERLKAHNSPEAPKRNAFQPRKYEWNGEIHTAKEWAEKTKQAIKTVRKHFRENGTPYTTFKENKGYFKEKSYTWNGITKKVSEWADDYNCTVNAMHKRFRKNGSPEDTVGRRKTHYFTFNGETHTYKEWGEKYGISAERMYVRIKRYGTPLPKQKPESLSPKSNQNQTQCLVQMQDDESSDEGLYWCDGECKTIEEWAHEYGLSKQEVKKNFEQFGMPQRPEYDYSDIAEDLEGESEEDIDAILRDIDQKRKIEKVGKQESIKEWLERIKHEPDDGRPLKEILGGLN